MRVVSVTFDASWWVILVFVVDLAIRITAVIVVPRNRRPTAAMAWLLFVIIMLITVIQVRFGNRFVYYEGDR